MVKEIRIHDDERNIPREIVIKVNIKIIFQKQKSYFFFILGNN